MIFRLVPIVIMTITQTESWYVERLQIARLQECKKEIRTSLDYVERPQDSQHTAKPFYIASDTHEESVLAGKFQFVSYKMYAGNILDFWQYLKPNFISFEQC